MTNFPDAGVTVHQLNIYRWTDEWRSKHGFKNNRFSSLVERKSFIVLGDPSSELRKLLDQFGASRYFVHLASYTSLP